MNADIRTLALAPSDARLLRSLLRKELPAEIHVIVTSELDPKVKTKKLESLFQDHQILGALLSWSPKDEEVGKAFRQVNVEAVLRLRGLLLEQLPMAAEALPPKDGATLLEYGSRTLLTLDKAISLASDQPFMPVNMNRPQGRA